MEAQLYYKSYDKFFRVVLVAKSTKEANEFMDVHEDCGVIGEENGLVFVAEFKESQVKL